MSQFPNYLISNRKRLALSQADVAFLLGAASDEKVCRHERFVRESSLADALAYEVVFKRSVSELFSGEYRRIETEIVRRAKILLEEDKGRKLSGRALQRRRMIAEIAGINIEE